MNRFDLNTEELINLLMDKDTSAVDKTLILEELQKNPESKTLIDEYSHLQSTFNNVKTTAVPPPTDWTNSVMEQVRLISERHFAYSWFGKLKYALLGLLLLIPFGLYLSLSDNDEKSNITVNKDTNTQISVENNIVSQNQLDINNPNDIKSQPKTVKKTDKIILDVIANNNFIANETKDNAKKISDNNISYYLESNSLLNLNEEMNLNINTVDLSNIQIKDIYNSDIQSNSQDISITPRVISPISLFNLNLSKNSFIIQSRGSYAITNPEKSFAENDFFGNTYNLGIYLDVYDNVYAGAEFGSEVFSQIFLDNAQPGTVYDQSPTLFYFGLSGKYEANQLSFGAFKPVGHLFVGGSSLGPLVRANTVIQANVINSIGIFVGLEGSLLYYKNQNIWYNSGKLGLVGGINFKF